MIDIIVESFATSVTWTSVNPRFFSSLEFSLCQDPKQPIKKVSKWIAQSLNTAWSSFRYSVYSWCSFLCCSGYFLYLRKKLKHQWATVSCSYGPWSVDQPLIGCLYHRKLHHINLNNTLYFVIKIINYISLKLYRLRHIEIFFFSDNLKIN